MGLSEDQISFLVGAAWSSGPRYDLVKAANDLGLGEFSRLDLNAAVISWAEVYMAPNIAIVVRRNVGTVDDWRDEPGCGGPG